MGDSSEGKIKVNERQKGSRESKKQKKDDSLMNLRVLQIVPTTQLVACSVDATDKDFSVPLGSYLKDPL